MGALYKWCLVLVLGGASGLAQAVNADIEVRFKQVMADIQTRQKAEKAGKRAAFFCENCHGETGNSPLPNVPNLAGQNPVYLLNQIEKFGDGRRNDPFMSGLVKLLKPEERFHMSVFYAGQKVVPTPAKDARLAKVGQEHYQRACRGCHGADARGSKEVARLAGQRADYLVTALKGYRTGQGTRSDPTMTSLARKLDERQIQALSVYLSSLP